MLDWFYQRLDNASTIKTETTLNSEDIRDWCLKNGADDVGFVEIDRAGAKRSEGGDS